MQHNSLIGVIGGTIIDANLCKYFLETKNLSAITANISKDPYEQTVLQLTPEALTRRVQHAIHNLIKKGCSSIFIYCNSMSTAIELNRLRANFKTPIFTPLETYSLIANQHNAFALITANCQALNNLKKNLLIYNPSAVITGFASLALVNDIENGLSPTDIIKKYDLISYCKMLEDNNIPSLILGCTHFSYLYKKLTEAMLKENIHLNLFDPSEAMFNNLINYQQSLVSSPLVTHG